MNQAFYTLFDTAIGRCGIVWRQSRHNDDFVVTGFQLPAVTVRSAEIRLRAKWSACKARSAPPLILDIIHRVKLHLNGDSQSFCDVKLDLDGIGSFTKQIYDAARAIPSGQTMTYGNVAKLAGHTGAARAVGMAMSRNPVPLIIPCHRVLAAGHKPGGFTAHGGLNTKARMLEAEGATLVRPATFRSERDLRRAATLLGKQDPRLVPVLSQSVDFKLALQNSPYHTLVTAVVHQQLSPKAAKTILERVISIYSGKKLPEPAELVNTSENQLRSAGLSRLKARSLRDIAAKALDGTIPAAKEIMLLSNEEIKRRLTPIYGVGRWTVEMMLIFNLGRMDVFPVDDYALRKSMADVLRMKVVPTPREALRLSKKWEPYRSVASLYLWGMGNDGVSSS